ncbi:hypothetical protein RV07_GL000224 [Enterococcus malodoratus]|nr:hypothetical protein RV07_GL000224 [Enterococcus malodoratus]
MHILKKGRHMQTNIILPRVEIHYAMDLVAMKLVLTMWT